MRHLLALAYAIAAQGFKNKFDKQGRPYMEHCLYVADGMDTDAEKIVALLHDAVEDEIVTFEELRQYGFPEDIIRDIDLLTHRKDVDDYLDVYIKKIAMSLRATKVKKRDLRHNSDITRLKSLTKADFDRIEKYHRAFTYLSQV